MPTTTLPLLPNQGGQHLTPSPPNVVTLQGMHLLTPPHNVHSKGMTQQPPLPARSLFPLNLRK